MEIYGDKIFTRRLLLRKVEDDDIPLLVAWSKTSAAYGEYLTPERLEMEDMREKLAAGVFWNDRERLFLVERRGSTSLGTIHYWQPLGREETVIISLKIAVPLERNRGYGTEAQKYLIMHVFERKFIQQIEMYTDIDNYAQQHCLYKLGFEMVDSLNYDDQQEMRTGYLFRLSAERYKAEPIYRFHYE